MNIEVLHWAQQSWVARIMYVSCPLLDFVSFRGHPGPHWGWERWDRWFPCFGVYTLCLLKGSNPRCHRQHFRLSICFDFYWAWQILRRLRWPPVSGCGLFDGPQLSEKCLKVAVFGGLAVPHIWNHYWVGFWGHIYITVELGRTFLSLLLTSDSSNLGRVGFVQIGANLDLFELEMIFLLHPTSSHPTY